MTTPSDKPDADIVAIARVLVDDNDPIGQNEVFMLAREIVRLSEIRPESGTPCQLCLKREVVQRERAEKAERELTEANENWRKDRKRLFDTLHQSGVVSATRTPNHQQLEALIVEVIRRCGVKGGVAPEIYGAMCHGVREIIALAEADTTPVSTSGLLDEAGKFFDWGNAVSGALKNLLDAYERRVRSACESQEQIAKKPWECAEFIEARRVLESKPNWFVTVSATGTPTK